MKRKAAEKFVKQLDSFSPDTLLTLAAYCILRAVKRESFKTKR